MNKKSKIKFELTAANNGYIVGLVNPDWGKSTRDEEYYRATFVGEDLGALFKDLVSQLVVDRFEATNDR